MSSSKMSEGLIRKVCEADLPMIHKWTTEAEWNMPMMEIEVVFKYKPEGFYCLQIEEKIVGCAFGANIENQYGFVGLVLVDKEFRRRGIASRLLEQVLNFLKNYSLNIGLNSEPSVTEMYARRGFNTTLWTNEHYSGNPDLKTLPDGYLNVTFSEPSNCLEKYNEIIKYDSFIHPWNRNKYWQLLGEYSEVKCIIASNNDEVVGFGCIAPQLDGYRIMPLYADNEDIAKCLFKRLCLSVSEINVSGNDWILYIDHPNVQQKLPFFHDKYGMKRMKSSHIRMYTNEELNVPWDKVYVFSNFDMLAV